MGIQGGYEGKSMRLLMGEGRVYLGREATRCVLGKGDGILGGGWELTRSLMRQR